LDLLSCNHTNEGQQELFRRTFDYCREVEAAPSGRADTIAVLLTREIVPHSRDQITQPIRQCVGAVFTFDPDLFTGKPTKDKIQIIHTPALWHMFAKNLQVRERAQRVVLWIRLRCVTGSAQSLSHSAY
jgi:hypothetical protein